MGKSGCLYGGQGQGQRRGKAREERFESQTDLKGARDYSIKWKE